MQEKKLRVLFVISGETAGGSPITRNQGASLSDNGVSVEYYLVEDRGIGGYLRNVRPLRRQIKTNKYDVVHAHYAFCGYLASLATFGLSVPVVTSIMGSDIKAHRIYPFIVRLFARLTPWNAVIVKSKEMKQRLGLRQAIVIPNGVNMNRFVDLDKSSCQERLGWDGKKLHVLFPAKPYEKRKNWSLAEDAVNRLNSFGKYKIELHGMVGVPNEDTPIWYNAADAVVLPSFYEGSANAVKETMACERPIVTTDMGDCRERMEGVDGCYVAKTYDVDEFVELLKMAIEFEGRTKGRERLLKDGIADYQIAERLINIYEQV